MRTEEVIRPPNEVVLACRIEMLQESMVTMVSAFRSLHKYKTNGKFPRMCLCQLLPINDALIMRNVNAMHFIIARHTHTIPFRPVARLPPIGIWTNKEIIETSGKHQYNTQGKHIAHPNRHDKLLTLRLLLFSFFRKGSTMTRTCRCLRSGYFSFIRCSHI